MSGFQAISQRLELETNRWRCLTVSSFSLQGSDSGYCLEAVADSKFNLFWNNQTLMHGGIA
jgi:hypothetical protein